MTEIKEKDEGPRRDRDGTPLRVGDMVRVIGVPPKVRGETRAVFRHLVGQYKRITAFEWGEVRLDFRVRRGRYRYHAVWIEPDLLKKRTPRKPLKVPRGSTGVTARLRKQSHRADSPTEPSRPTSKLAHRRDR